MRTLALMTIAFGAAVLSAPAAADVTLVDISFSNQYQQTGATTQTFIGSFFSSRAFQDASPAPYASGTLTYPGPASPAQLAPTPGDPTLLFYQTTFLPSQAVLEAAFPQGEYRFDFPDAATQSRTALIDHGPTLFAPLVPTVTSVTFNALGSIAAGQAFTFDLTAGFTPPPAATDSFTFFTLFDRVTNAVVYSDSSADTSTTSFTVPTGIFVAGHGYAAETVFSNRVGNTSEGIFTTDLSDVRSFVEFDIAAGVPEPATWALLIGGIGLTGGALRRRRPRQLSPTA